MTIICEKCDKIKQEELKEKYTRCQIYGDPEYWCYQEFSSVRLLFESMYSAQTERMLTYEEVFGHKPSERRRSKKIIKEYLDELLKDGRSACISCGYIIEDIPGEHHDLYEGYGCPKCHSPLVMKKATGNELNERRL